MLLDSKFNLLIQNLLKYITINIILSSLILNIQFTKVRILILVLELLPPVRPMAWYLPLPIPRLRWTSKRRRIDQKMREAPSHEEWKKLAVEMSELHGREGWKEVAEDSHYHCRVVIAATQRLAWARENSDYEHLIETLTPCMVKNFGGTMNLKLYSHTHCGTKRVVDVSAFNTHMTLYFEICV